jgi:hypothetical protein
MQYSFILIACLILSGTGNLVQANSSCVSSKNSVESEGKVCASGKNVAITSAAEMLIPSDWTLRFLNDEIVLQKVSWPDGRLWVDTLDLIGRSGNIGFLIDGERRMAIAMRPSDNVQPGAVMVNSRISRTREIYNLDEVFARVDDIERVRRENKALKEATVVPHSKLNSKSLVEARSSFVSVEDALFVTNINEGDLERALRDFFFNRWNYQLVLNKRGFSSKPRLKTMIAMNGMSVRDDATTLQSKLNLDNNYDYSFRIYKGNDVVHLNITCLVCNHE